LNAHTEYPLKQLRQYKSLVKLKSRCGSILLKDYFSEAVTMSMGTRYKTEVMSAADFHRLGSDLPGAMNSVQIAAHFHNF
jgi:hypothetical protein